VLWIYKWFRPDGEVGEEQLAKEMQDVFFGGLETEAKAPRRSRARAAGRRG
jgi:hypothetical protein